MPGGSGEWVATRPRLARASQSIRRPTQSLGCSQRIFRHHGRSRARHLGRWLCRNSYRPATGTDNDKLYQSLYLVARLKDGVSAQQAGATVNLLFKQLLQEQAGAQPSAERIRDIERASIELTSWPGNFRAAPRVLALSANPDGGGWGRVADRLCQCGQPVAGAAAAREKEFALRLALERTRASTPPVVH